MPIRFTCLLARQPFRNLPCAQTSEVPFDFVPQKSGHEARGFKRGFKLDNDSVEFVPIPRRAKNNAPVPSHRNSHY